MANVHPYMNSKRMMARRKPQTRLHLSSSRSAFPPLLDLVLHNQNSYFPKRSLKSSHRPRPEGQAADVASESMQQELEETVAREAKNLREELTRLTRNLCELNRPDVTKRTSRLNEESHGVTEPPQLDTDASATWPQQNPPPLGQLKVFPANSFLEISRNLSSFYSADDARDVGEVLTLPKGPVRHMATTISRGFTPRSIFFSAPCRTVSEFSCESEDLVLEYTPLLRNTNHVTTDTPFDSVMITSVSDHDSWIFDSTFSTDGNRSTMERSMDFELSAVSTTSKSHSTLPMNCHSTTMEQTLDLEHAAVSNASLDFLFNCSISRLTERDLTRICASSAGSMAFVSSLSDCSLSLPTLSCPNDIHSSTWVQRPSFDLTSAGIQAATNSHSAKNPNLGLSEPPSASSSLSSDPTFYSASCHADCQCYKEPRPRRDEGTINHIMQPAPEPGTSGSVMSSSDCSLSFHSLLSCRAGCRCTASSRGLERVVNNTSCSFTHTESFLSEESNYRADATFAINNTSQGRDPPENAAFRDPSSSGAHNYNPSTSKDTLSSFPSGLSSGEAEEMEPRRIRGPDETRKAVKRVRFVQPTHESGEDGRGVSSSHSSEKRVARTRSTRPIMTCLYRFITFSLPLRRKPLSRADTAAATTAKQPRPGILC